MEYSEYEKLRDFIIAELKKIKDPEGQQYTHIADRVENIYKGDYGWYAGDVQFCGYRDSSGIKVPGKKNDGLYQIDFGGFGRDGQIWDNPRRHFTGYHGNALTSFIARRARDQEEQRCVKGRPHDECDADHHAHVRACAASQF